MTRQTTLLFALGMLIAAALAVGLSGWILLVRDARLSRTSSSSIGRGAPAEVDEGH